MIKINLLSEGRQPAVARAAGPVRVGGGGMAGENTAAYILGAIAIVGVLVTLGHFLLLRGELNALNEKIVEAEKEVAILAPIIKEVEEFKSKKAELERKIRVITDLRANQRGPVQIMDKISRALPELLWLDAMTFKSNSVTLSGEAFNTNAVAAFIDNLDTVPEFKEPVLVKTTEKGPVYSFEINFNFVTKRQEQGTAVGG